MLISVSRPASSPPVLRTPKAFCIAFSNGGSTVGPNYFSQGDFLFSKRANRGLSAGGASTMATNRRNASSLRLNWVLSSNTDSASRQAASRMKSERLRPCASAARSISAFWLGVTRRRMLSALNRLDSGTVVLNVFSSLCAHN